MSTDAQQNDIDAVLGKRVADFPPERQLMYGLIRATRPWLVLEAGVSDGVGSVVIARALKHNGFGQLVGVDDWSLTHGGRADSPDVPLGNVLADGTPAHFVDFQTGDAVKWLRGWPDDSADIVIVDADHGGAPSSEGAWEALRVATRLVMVHDTEILPLVRRACWETAGRVGRAGVFVPSSRGFWIVEAVNATEQS